MPSELLSAKAAPLSQPELFHRCRTDVPHHPEFRNATGVCCSLASLRKGKNADHLCNKIGKREAKLDKRSRGLGICGIFFWEVCTKLMASECPLYVVCLLAAALVASRIR